MRSMIQRYMYFGVFELESSLDRGPLIDSGPPLLQMCRHHQNLSLTATFFTISIWALCLLCLLWSSGIYWCCWLIYLIWTFIVVGFGRLILLNWLCLYSKRKVWYSFFFQTYSFGHFRFLGDRTSFWGFFGVNWWRRSESTNEDHSRLS